MKEAIICWSFKWTVENTHWHYWQPTWWKWLRGNCSLGIFFLFKCSYVLWQAGRVKIWPKCDETVSHQWCLSGWCIIHGWYLRSSIIQSKSLTIHTDTKKNGRPGQEKRCSIDRRHNSEGFGKFPESLFDGDMGQRSRKWGRRDLFSAGLVLSWDDHLTWPSKEKKGEARHPTCAVLLTTRDCFKQTQQIFYFDYDWE